MATKQPHVQYVTRYRALLQQEVEVVLTQRSDGSWVLIHCREKNKQCDGHECPLRMQGERFPWEFLWF